MMGAFQPCTLMAIELGNYIVWQTESKEDLPETHCFLLSPLRPKLCIMVVHFSECFAYSAQIYTS